MKIKYANCDIFFDIDEESWNMVSQHNTKVYRVTRGARIYSKILKRNIPIARLILGKLHDDGYNADHIDRNYDNHSKDNLRMISLNASAMNRRKWTNTLSSKYKGVFWNKQNKNWRVVIYANKARYNGGSFSDEIEAAKVANELMKKHHGEFAVLNVI